MKILLIKNKNDEFGELVEMNELFSKVLIALGKAKENGDYGAKIKDLYWCGKGKIVNSKRKQEKGGIDRRVYKTKRVGYSILKKPGTYNITPLSEILQNRIMNYFWTKHRITIVREDKKSANYTYDNPYPMGSTIHRSVKSPFLTTGPEVVNYSVIDYEKPLKKVLKSWGLWNEEWTAETYLSLKMIMQLEKDLNKLYAKKLGQEKETIV